MKPTYENMTADQELGILSRHMIEAGTLQILQIDGVYSLLKENFNNEILDTWAGEHPDDMVFTEAERRELLHPKHREFISQLLEERTGTACSDEDSMTELVDCLESNVQSGDLDSGIYEEIFNAAYF